MLQEDKETCWSSGQDIVKTLQGGWGHGWRALFVPFGTLTRMEFIRGRRCGGNLGKKAFSRFELAGNRPPGPEMFLWGAVRLEISTQLGNPTRD